MRQKIIVLSVSLLGVLLYVLAYFNEAIGFPSAFDSFCCSDDLILNVFLIFIPISFFGVILFNMRHETYRTWSIFTIIWLIVSMLIYYFSPSQPQDYIKFQKEIVSLFSSSLYVCSSLVLIAYKYFTLRGK